MKLVLILSVFVFGGCKTTSESSSVDKMDVPRTKARNELDSDSPKPRLYTQTLALKVVQEPISDDSPQETREIIVLDSTCENQDEENSIKKFSFAIEDFEDELISVSMLQLSSKDIKEEVAFKLPQLRKDMQQKVKAAMLQLEADIIKQKILKSKRVDTKKAFGDSEIKSLSLKSKIILSMVDPNVFGKDKTNELKKFLEVHIPKIQEELNRVIKLAKQNNGSCLLLSGPTKFPRRMDYSTALYLYLDRLLGHANKN